MDVPCTICEDPLLSKFSLKLNSECTINITTLSIVKNKRSQQNALMKKVGIEEKKINYILARGCTLNKKYLVYQVHEFL